MTLILRLRSLLVCAVLLPAALYCACVAAADAVPVPALSSPVTDLTHTLTAEQNSALESTLRAFEARKGSQIAILIVPTTQPETIEQFSIRVTDAWQLGRKGVDDGVLLAVAKDDRTVRIEVGRGLEGVLTDATSNRIIRNVITPRFRNGEFYAGLSDGVTRIIQVVDGEALPEAANSASRDNVSKIPWPLLIFAVVVGGSVLRAIFGRLGAASITAGGVGLLIWLFVGTLLGSLVAGVFAFAFVLLSGGGGGGWNSGPRGWGGGGLGGGGFGGGGGGWSGGGGGFSGGGSSGRW